MNFRQYVLKRLLYVLPTLFFVSVAVFSILHLIPGHPVDALLAEGQDPEMREILIKAYDLDKPIHIQYINWVSKAFQGNFGQSIIHARPVEELIGAALPRTIYLAIGAMIVGLILSLPMGVFAAVKRKSWVDYTAQVSALIGLSVPAFWEALMLMYLFGLTLKWVPVVGYTAPNENFVSFLHHLVLPATTLGVEMIGVLTRMTRSTMLDQLNKDYVQTHLAMGLVKSKIVGLYTLKNAMLPTLTISSIRFAHLLGGTVVIESVFAWPGIGLMILDGIMNKDYPLVQGGIIMMSVTFIIINLIVDILYKLLDPRIKLD